MSNPVSFHSDGGQKKFCFHTYLAPPQATRAFNRAGYEGAIDGRSLHQKLLIETENIIRWKAVTEINTKNLELQVKEAHSLNENQHRNFLELKFYSGYLSQTLIRKRQDNKLLLTKVDNAREMFLSLKEQYENLLRTTSHFHGFSVDLVGEQQDLYYQLEQFKEISEANRITVEQINDTAKENKCSLEELKGVFKSKLLAMDDELGEFCNTLTKLCDDQEDAIEKLNSGVSDLAVALDKKAAILCQLEEVGTTRKGVLEDLQNTTDTLTSRAVKAEQELLVEEEKLRESRSEFQEAAEKIVFLKKSNDLLEAANSEISEKVSVLTSLIRELEQEIAHKGEALKKLEAAHSSHLHELKRTQWQINDLGSRFAVLKPRCRDMKLENKKILSVIDDCQKSLTGEQEHAHQLEEEMPVLKGEVEKLEETVSQLRQQVAQQDQHHCQQETTNKDHKQELMDTQEAIEGFRKQTSEAEECSIQLEDKISIVQEEYNNFRDKLSLKTKDCKDLAGEMQHLKSHMKKLQKEIKSITKGEVSESKIKNNMSEKMASLHRKLKEQTDDLKNLQDFCDEQEMRVSEKQQSVEEHQTSLKESLCEQQTLRQYVDTKVTDVNTIKSTMQSDLETLRAELECKNAKLSETFEAHKQEVCILQERHQDQQAKKKMALCNLKEQQQKELEELRSRMEQLQNGKRKAEEDAEAGYNERLISKQESESNVKELVGVLEKYNCEKDTRLKEEKQQLQEYVDKIAQLSSEKVALQSEVDKVKVMATEDKAKEVTRLLKHSMSTVPVESTEWGKVTCVTPSPDTYLPSLMSVFVEPQVPKMPYFPKAQESKSVGGLEDGGILKSANGLLRRTLMPPELQKRLVFKTPTTSQEFNSDSSSDAWALEVADRDDPFEELKCSSRSALASRAARIPRVNIGPFSHTTATPASTTTTSTQSTTSTTTQFISHQPFPQLSSTSQRMKTSSYQKRKARDDQLRLITKTYSNRSPHFKTSIPKDPPQ